MSRRRIALYSAAGLVGAIVLAFFSAAAWILYTPSGLAWLTARLSGYAGEGLTLERVAGTLAGGATIGHVRYTGEDIEVIVDDAAVALSPLSLLALEPRIRYLRAAKVAVTTKPSEPTHEPPDSLALPADFAVDVASIDRLVVDMGKGPLDVSDVRLAYEGGRRVHELTDFGVVAFGYAIRMHGKIDAAAPFAIDAEVSAESREAKGARAEAKLGGNLSAIRANGSARAEGGTVSFDVTATPYAALPIGAAKVDAKNVDLRAFMPSLPATALAANVALEPKGDALAGTVHVTNAIPGPYDKKLLPLASLDAKLTTNLEVAGVTALDANLGAAGSIAGSGKVDADRATLTLKANKLDLAALYSTLKPTHLAGSAEIAATRARQSVSLALRQDDIALELDASRAGDAIDVARFSASARGGKAGGKAHLNLAGGKPFAAQATFARFDPAAWGDFPAGSISGRASASGSLAVPAADVTLAIDDSRWLGAPLAARADASFTPERLRRLDLDARLGGNRVHASGALGAPSDVLALDFDAPRLELVDRALHGTIRGSARVSGALRSPRVAFDVAGSALAYDAYRVKSIAAKGALSFAQSGAFDLDAALQGIATPQLALSAAHLKLDGTRAAHTIAVTAKGDRVDLAAAARGALAGNNGWRGTIESLVNRGELPVRLVAPVALAAGPARTHVDPFALEVVGGRLTVSALDYDGGRLVTSGRLSDLPLKPFLALAGNPAGTSTTLRVSGSWDVRNTPQWLGTVTLRRDSGDLAVALADQRKVTLGLTALALDANLTERAVDVRANVASALATLNAEGRVAPIGSGAGARYTAASPLEFTAALNVARLAPLATFIDTPMLIEGEAHARLQGRGTIGDPQITGPITARRLALALPVQGVNLTDGTLDARLEQQTIRVDNFSIRGGDGTLRAQGTLARAAYDEASIDWRAERFTALARPDRRLIVSGSGNAALKGGKLSLTGKLAANQGEFEIGGADLPTLGDDVVIAGRTPRRDPNAPPEPKAFGALALDLTLDLGRQVHVLGNGLSVWLAGNVHVYTGPRGDVLAKGTVIARNGTIAAYGQRLEVDRGRIYFDGPIANPSLDIVAMRKRQAVEAGVEVTGSIHDPLVRIVSNPQVPEGEALSWLVLGHAPTEAGAGELSALPLAATAAFGKATGGIKNRLKLDELSLANNAGSQFVTLGKRIGKRLYVGFEQSLGAAQNVLRLELTLTRRIALRAQTGQTSLLGLFYRYRWD
jgi:translocation and assembly module TamB